MHIEHIERVLGLLDDKSFCSQRFWERRGPLPTNKARIQWKWFLRDIGKHSCILGLLPFLEAAKHLRRTPFIESGHMTMIDEREEKFLRKTTLVSEWADDPSRAKTREVLHAITPSGCCWTCKLKSYGVSPNEKSTVFVNYLIRIILDDRHFQNDVFSAFDCLADIGYEPSLISSAFRRNVRLHYEQKRNQPTP